MWGSIYLINNPVFLLRSVLDIVRFTRTTYTLMGLISYLTSQMSFYHLLILSTICHLLEIAEYTTYFLSLPDARDSTKGHVSRIIKQYGFVLGVMLNLFLFSESFRLLVSGLYGQCIGASSSGKVFDFQKAWWVRGIPDMKTLKYYLALEGVFTTVVLFQGEERTTSQTWHYWRLDASQRILLFCSLIYSLYLIVSSALTQIWLSSLSFR